MIFDEKFGRFQGAQFDLDVELEHGEEVMLDVKCKVTEISVRSASSGKVRKIVVLRPVDVLLQERIGGEPESSLELGGGVLPELPSNVYLPSDPRSLDDDVWVEPKPIKPLQRTDTVVERTIERIEQPKKKSIDPVLARFLHGDL